MLQGAFFEYVRDINNLGALAIRLILAAFCGAVIGIERGQKRRPAGFRTHMLVCMGAALTMILSQYLFYRYHGTVNVDTARFGAQVINGIGFLGAGTIIVTGRQEVKGLTTAAGMWAAASMGLAVGGGFIEGAVLGSLMIVVTIIVFARIETFVVNRARNINLYVEFMSIDDLGGIVETIKKNDIRIFDVEIKRRTQTQGELPGAVFSIRLPKRQPHMQVITALASLENVKTIEEV